jgi:hypothetical protein
MKRYDLVVSAEDCYNKKISFDSVQTALKSSSFYLLI